MVYKVPHANVVRSSQAGMPVGISMNILVGEFEPPRANRFFSIKQQRIIMATFSSQQRFNKNDIRNINLTIALKRVRCEALRVPAQW